MPTLTKREKAAGAVYDREKAHGVEEAIGILEKLPRGKVEETGGPSLPRWGGPGSRGARRLRQRPPAGEVRRDGGPLPPAGRRSEARRPDGAGRGGAAPRHRQDGAGGGVRQGREGQGGARGRG